MTFFARAILSLSLLASASSSFAQQGTQAERFKYHQMKRDYQANIYFLSLPPEVRADAGRRIAIVSGGGLLALIGADFLSTRLMAGIERKIFARVLAVGVSMGAVLFTDGFFAYMTDGRVMPFSMAVEELITFVKPAAAATLGDHYMANYKEFLTIGADHGAEIMAMNPELAATVRVYAQVCREMVGEETCK